jgi:hypothetical protein
MRKYLALSAAALAISLIGLGLTPAQAAGVSEGAFCLTAEEAKQEFEQRQSERSATGGCAWGACLGSCEYWRPPCTEDCTPFCDDFGLCSPIGCVFVGCGWAT